MAADFSSFSENVCNTIVILRRTFDVEFGRRLELLGYCYALNSDPGSPTPKHINTTCASCNNALKTSSSSFPLVSRSVKSTLLPWTLKCEAFSSGGDFGTLEMSVCSERALG
ncbi:rho1 gtpase [Moniliophthora roreri]|nr:rho1 gtpase [Moniliophthora roreri]